MADKDSNNNGNRDPWGREPIQGPPDLIELIKKFLSGKSSKNSNKPNNSGNLQVMRYVGYIAAGIFLLWILAGIYVVKPTEQAVILRFGRYVATEGPGPHWVAPVIESRYVLNVQEINNFPYQSEMLTRDENIVSVALAVQYRISNPNQYLFNVVGPVETLQQATSSALRQVVGEMTLNDVLTTGREELRTRVQDQLIKTLGVYKAGLDVTDVTLQSAKPPEAVTAAFDDAINAREDEQRYINKAEAYMREKTALAQGTIATLQQSAEAYQQEVVLKAQGDTARYLALLKPYLEAPGVTRDRLYIDAVENVLSHTRNVLIDSSINNLMYLPLDQMMKNSVDTSKVNPVPLANIPTPLATPGSPPSVYSTVSRPSYPTGGDR